MAKVEIKKANWSKVFGLVGKLVKYGQGGYTHKEKLELISDVLGLLGALSEDIQEDIDKDIEARNNGKGKENDKQGDSTP